MSVVAFQPARDAQAVDAVAEVLGVELGEARAGWLRFAELVGQWGQRTDLVAAESAQALAEILFLDAAALVNLVPSGATVLDVGAGVGAPTIPLALLRPDLRIELLEPRRRRVTFLRTAIGSLGLASRAKVVEGKLGDEGHAPVDVALSRATFAPDEWLRRASGFAGRVVVLLGRGEEPASNGWKVEGDRAYEVPSSGAHRRAVVYAPDA
ncbi:MAG: class I SAM-dependent methyltransferase [Sandaracinus sp.]|nr:class I SAM-dependent methyltransferase [Sandaracinus sp.]MCB9611662.1 class I SAM-dependent methyltransferase [Sandaracinus sp.]MCB9618876.1 class I SAM-dependent methyltransferase [Sandaracinus sp.]MCB9623274.1 class I SAM-dependent methyltransferase [Sandaracinus sp.]MCB9633822.1 class I SAM-dependent methyltransferase [Sandaracinus sp.]